MDAMVQRLQGVRGWAVLLGVLLLLLAAGCGRGPVLSSAHPAVVTATTELPAPGPRGLAGNYRDAGEYRLGPQDLLEVSVFGLPDLTRSVRVNASGQISLPLAGTLDAGGRTLVELEQAIAERLRDGYLQAPQVSVFVKEFTSQRVTVEGAVGKPGIYPLTGRTSLLQAIAMAEGLDPLANTRGVVVFRSIEGQRMGAVFDIGAIRGGRMPDPQIYGDDVVVVDQSGAKTALRRFVESVPAFAVFTLF